jgi:hypothetical protein
MEDLPDDDTQVSKHLGTVEKIINLKISVYLLVICNHRTKIHCMKIKKKKVTSDFVALYKHLDGTELESTKNVPKDQ